MIDTSKESEDVSLPSCEFYRRLYGGVGGGEGEVCTNEPPTIQTSVKFRDFAELYLR